MSFYDDFVLPWCIDVSCGMKALVPEREKVAAGLHGAVLEIGFGSGLNLPLLPAAVTHVLAVEPNQRARRLGEKRIAAARCQVEFVGLDAQVLQLEDARADTALSTFTLCTIPDAVHALREIRRVLKPGGRLFFLEHGRSPERGVARWQDRLNRMQQVIAGGCNINRDIPGLLKEAGFDLDPIAAAYFEKMPRTHGYLYSGSAVSN